jgi:hypothetical protein
MGLLQEQREPFPLGGLLLPDGLHPESLLPPATSPTRFPPAGLLEDDPVGLLSARHREGFLLFIPRGRSQGAGNAPATVTPPQDLVEVSPDFIRECEDLEPNACLLDPHHLLAEIDSEDLRRLLAYHAGEASTFANFLLLESNEQLPASADLSRIARGRLAQDHACLTVYPLAEPWRARIFMTRKITVGIPTDYLRGILQACVQDSLRASDPVEQLQRFATQLSIRLIWMERAYPAVFATADEATLTEPAPEPALEEVAQSEVAVAAEPSLFRRWERTIAYAMYAVAALLASILACRALARWRSRRIRNSVWILPDVEVKPRFGGPHCGQGGVWIRYG